MLWTTRGPAERDAASTRDAHLDVAAAYVALSRLDEPTDAGNRISDTIVEQVRNLPSLHHAQVSWESGRRAVEGHGVTVYMALGSDQVCLITATRDTGRGAGCVALSSVDHSPFMMRGVGGNADIVVGLLPDGAANARLSGATPAAVPVDGNVFVTAAGETGALRWEDASGAAAQQLPSARPVDQRG